MDRRSLVAKVLSLGEGRRRVERHERNGLSGTVCRGPAQPHRQCGAQSCQGSEPAGPRAGRVTDLFEEFQMEMIFVGAVSAAMLLGGVLATYHQMVRLDPLVALRVVQAKKKHAVQWARYYSHEAICFSRQKNHIASADALAKKSRRMRAARHFSDQAKALAQKIARSPSASFTSKVSIQIQNFK